MLSPSITHSFPMELELDTPCARMAQADLADLQDRFAALADEKLQLERFLDDLAQKVSQSMEADQLQGTKAGSKRVGTRTRPTAKSSAKTVKKTSRAKSS